METKSYSHQLTIAANQNIKERDYWWRKMAGELVKSSFPHDYDRVGIGKAVDTLEFIFPGELFSQLMKISNQSDDNLYIILAAALAALLSAYTGNRDIILGAPIYKQDTDGEFINTVLPLRNQLLPAMTFKELLLQVRETVVQANEHQNYPIEALLHHLRLEVDQTDDGFPLLDTAVLLTNIHDKQYLDSIPLDMIFSFTRKAKTIAGVVEYHSLRYEKRTGKQIIRHLENLLDQALVNPDLEVSRIDILSAEERKQLLVDFNRPETELPGAPIPLLLERQVEKTPDHIALIGQINAYGEMQLTYEQLNEKSNQLAGVLIERGVKPDTIVGIVMDASLEMVIGILGIIKAGGAYLPIDIDTSGNRLTAMLADSHTPLLLTRSDISLQYAFSVLQGLQSAAIDVYTTGRRQQVTNLDALPIPDRSLVNIEKYHRYIGQSLFKHSISLLASRGCPYRCAYCHKIWPSGQVTRSAENMFTEVQLFYNMGIRRFVFLDDIFNLDVKNTTRFFKMIIENHLDLWLSLCLRADILTGEYIDLMVQAGTARVSVALETASPRLQKQIGKNLDLEKFRENIEYLCKHYPQVILELNTMHGFPSETKEEALMTLDFLKSLKWIHFPYLNILKIYQNTRMEKLALTHGISREAIASSAGLAYHELPETLPFDKKFTLQYQADFLNGYFLSKERLLHVLPFQIKALTEDELVQKYKSYLPADIRSFDDLLQFTGISIEELKIKEFLEEDKISVTGLNKKMQEHFRGSRRQTASGNPLKVLLLDLSQFFSSESRGMLYDVVEAPIGLMYLATYLGQRFGSKISCQIAKSRVDFDHYNELKALLAEFKPHVIGMRSLTYYRGFFHRTAAMIRQWSINAPIIAGGPYATADYHTLLQDGNIDLVVLGEGEITFSQLIEKIRENGNQLPEKAILKEIPGLAFALEKTGKRPAREVIMMDILEGTLDRPNRETRTNPEHINQPADLAYVIYTSGSTGSPKGVTLTHRNVHNLVSGLKDRIYKDYIDNLKVALVAPYVFDASVKQIFGALLQGHCLYLVPEDTRIDGFRLQEFYQKHCIDISDGTPGHIHLLLESSGMSSGGPGIQSLSVVKHFIIGGESLLRQTALDFFNRFPAAGAAPRITNIYGPSECCVDSTSFDISRETISSQKKVNLPIGSPLLNQQVYILEPVFPHRLQPVGVPGELCIGGANVARGYLNNPELTAEKFCLRRPGGRFLKKLPPWTPRKNFLLFPTRSPHSPIYKTGDLARWLPDGKIEFLERIDRQVKIRGFRIEPAEIENLLQKQKGIVNAVVVPVSRDDSQFLCAYIVPRFSGRVSDGSSEEMAELREYLSRQLPFYMVPAFFIPLDKIPLTPNGKIDLRALPEPGVEGPGQEDSAPGNELEEKLADLWSEVLDIEKKFIGRDSNFFQLGGHSLKATTLIAKIHRELKVRIHLSEMFTTPTIEHLAHCIGKTGKTLYTPIEPVSEQEYYPLSYAQRRLWVLCQFEADSTAYNIPGASLISGPFNTAVFNRAINALALRHDSLRTVFIMREGEPRQVVGQHLEYHMETIDLQDTDKETREEKAREIYLEAAQIVFNLETGPLFLFKCIRLEKDKYLLMSNVHHIITDGWSTGILFNEIIILYNYFLKNRKNPLPMLKLQYKDYTRWHNALVESGGFSRAENYWLDKLKDKPNGIELPLDHSRKAVQTFNGSRVAVTLDSKKRSKLLRLCLEQEATLFMGMLTFLDILLSKYTGQWDIIVGLPIAGRKHPELNRVIGFLVNTLVHRIHLNPGRTFRQVLGKVKQEILECFEHQDYPFDLLIERLDLDRDLSQSPLFNVMLAYENADTQDTRLTMEGLTVTPYLHSEDFNMSKFDLTFFMYETEQEVLVRIEYNSDLFDRGTAERMGKNFLCLVENGLKNPDKPVYKLDYIDNREYEEIITGFNATACCFPSLTIRQLLEAQVKRTPDKTAVVGIEPEAGVGFCAFITYEYLNQQANRLSYYLRSRYQVQPGNVIGVAVDRSIEMIVVLLGIVKSGAAYVAVDPTYPGEHVRHILKDSGCRLVIIDRDRPGLLAGCRGETINIYSDWNRIQHQPTENPRVVNRLADILYVIYTSGSTGTPNGALLSHGILANLVQWQNRKTAIDASLNCLQFTSINFCVSFQEIFTTLTAGGKLHLIGDIERQDIEYLMNFITRRWIENLYLPFSYLNFLFRQSSAFGKSFKHSLKHIITAGEQLKITAGLKEFLERNPHIKLHNHYGSSEMHVVTAYSLDASTAGITPIPPAGKPIANTGIYILDDNGRPAAKGVWGELCAAGSWKVAGYINNPILTQEKQLKPLSLPLPHDKSLYCSGDIGRWLEDGNIQLMGRKDDQVKVRGFRVEPGEIESKILLIEGVKECAAVVKQDHHGQKFLAAYVVGTGEHISPPGIKRKLSHHLPQHMIPMITILERLPLMPNGKVDGDRLPEPEPGTREGVVLPRGTVEKKLAAIWSELLGIDEERIGIENNFFHLGGHSLKATTLVTRIHKEFNVKVKLLEIFQNPELRELAVTIKGLQEDEYTAVQPVEEKEYYPLSLSQKRLYILQQMETRAIGYNMPVVMTVEGNLETTKFQDTFAALVRRHESLRTSFKIVGDEPVQKVHDDVESAIGRWSLVIGEEESIKTIIQDFIRPFDLSQAPLLRVGLVNSGSSWILIVDMHHVISDGISMVLLVKEFTALFTGASLPNLKIRYKDFAQWQNRNRKSQWMQKQEAYWLSEFAGEVPVLNLPLDYTRPLVQEFAGAALNFQLKNETAGKLKALALGAEVTLYMLLLAIYYVWLSKITGQEEIIVGTPLAGRRHTDLEEVIGMFVNTLPIKNYPRGNMTFNDFLKELKTRTVNAFENQDYPFEDLVEQAEVNRDVSRGPLFDVMFTLRNIQGLNEEIPGLQSPDGTLKLKPYHFENKISKFDLVLDARESDNKILFSFEYRTKLFKEETIRKFISYFMAVVSVVEETPWKRLADIEIISEEEKKQVLDDFNRKEVLYPGDHTIPELFEEQAAKTPDHIALIEGTRGLAPLSVHVTYKELNEQSNRLAQRLREEGVKPDTIVGIMVEPCIRMLIGIWGILKAGGAYLPIDPDYPAERIKYMLQDSKIKLLVKNSSSICDFEHLNFEFVSNFEFRISNLNSSNLAYVIYTSGTTGRPKGVPITHRHLVLLVKWYRQCFPFETRHRTLKNLSYCFDFSILELLVTFITGGTLYLFDREELKDLTEYIDFINLHHIDTLHTTPGFLRKLVSAGKKMPGLKILDLGGDRLTAQLVNRAAALAAPDCCVYNSYGPTETTILCTFFTVKNSTEPAGQVKDPIPIGKPILKDDIYILDLYQKLVPVGIVGEISIGGGGVSAGYLNRPELTAEKFCLRQPGLKVPGKRIYMSYMSHMSYIYRTGDLARWLPDGNIQFLGRKDHQVKIRGYRIELEEIQYQLLKHPAVKEAVVMTPDKDKNSETSYLCAYVKADQAISTKTSAKQDFIPGLKRYLAEKLPNYMIPSHFVLIDEIPVTSNGKIDRKALPVPQSTGFKDNTTYLEPETFLEQVIAETWQEVLRKDIVGIDDNFFDLGGNSLDFIMVVNKLKEKLDKEIPVVTLFTYPTIRSLERYLNPAEGSEALPVTDGESGPSHRPALIEEGKNLMKQTLKKFDTGD